MVSIRSTRGIVGSQVIQGVSGIRLLLISLLVAIFVLYRITLASLDDSVVTVRLGDPANTYMEAYRSCPVASIQSLPVEVLEPKAGPRHMVDPPRGGKLTLVCCDTTKGSFSALLHHVWAPIGVARLVTMIRNQYFSTKVPLFRCTDACQFGLSGDPQATEMFNTKIQDDPMWLPPGPNHQKNDQGVRRYPEGMWTFAGAGPNSRSNQYVITLKPNLFMGGGSPWEVPLGEFVGNASFALLSRIYNGYKEKGPSQAILKREGVSEQVKEKWPLMDYILRCNIIDEEDVKT